MANARQFLCARTAALASSGEKSLVRIDWVKFSSGAYVDFGKAYTNVVGVKIEVEGKIDSLGRTSRCAYWFTTNNSTTASTGQRFVRFNDTSLRYYYTGSSNVSVVFSDFNNYHNFVCDLENKSIECDGKVLLNPSTKTSVSIYNTLKIGSVADSVTLFGDVWIKKLDVYLDGIKIHQYRPYAIDTKGVFLDEIDMVQYEILGIGNYDLGPIKINN